MIPDYITIGQRLKTARLNKKMTQEVLSEQLDISVPFLSRIERGISHINLKRLMQICSLLDVSEEYILHGNFSSFECTSQNLIKTFNNLSVSDLKLLCDIAQLMVKRN